MSSLNKLETQITSDDGSAGTTLKGMMALACRIIQRNAATQHFKIDDIDIYTDLKRQFLNTPGASALPAGHVCRNGS